MKTQKVQISMVPKSESSQQNLMYDIFNFWVCCKICGVCTLIKMIHKICLIRSFFYIRTFCTRNPTGISLGCYLLSWIFFSEKKCQISLTFWVSPSATLHLISFRRLTNSNSTSTWDHNCHFFLLWRAKVLQHNDQICFKYNR